MKTVFEPQDANFESRVRRSFLRQRVMHLIGAKLKVVEPGMVEIAIAPREDLSQQDGFMHAGIVTTVLDSACGYAAFTLMPADSYVLSVEFKVNLLAPAKGELITACRGETLWQDVDRLLGRCHGRWKNLRDYARDDDLPTAETAQELRTLRALT